MGAVSRRAIVAMIRGRRTGGDAEESLVDGAGSVGTGMVCHDRAVPGWSVFLPVGMVSTTGAGWLDLVQGT